MPEIANYKGMLATIRKEWDKAEQSIKLAEQVGNQVVFPAIKELRYGGRRIVDALSLLPDGDEEKFKALFDDALFDCYRARHDAVDAAISIIAAELNVTAKKLGYRPILDAFPEYPKLLETLRKAQAAIAASRGIRDDRDRIYTAIESVDLPALIEQYNRFQGRSDIMRGLAKSDRFWPLAGLIATIVFGVLATVLAYLALK